MWNINTSFCLRASFFFVVFLEKKMLASILYAIEQSPRATTTMYTSFDDVVNDMDARLQGALLRTLSTHHIKLSIVVDSLRASGNTKFDAHRRTIVITLSRRLFTQIPSTEVGQISCDVTSCWRHVLEHEIIHLLVLLVRIDNNIKDDEWRQISKHTHDTLYKTWLRQLYGHKDIYNNL